MEEEIIEAMESTAGCRGNKGRIGDPQVGDRADINLWRKRLLQFLEELDGDICVTEIRETLENWS